MRNDLQEGLWRGRDGETLRIAEMTTPHLHNCRKFASDQKLAEIDSELDRRNRYDHGSWH